MCDATWGFDGWSAMLEPVIPGDEQERLAKMRRHRLIYSPMEDRFDTITRAAQHDFHVPLALISLVGDDVQWFKSAQGLCAAEAPRRYSFCAHAIHEHDLFVVEDASKDERFFDNPVVTGPPYVRFYAGAPLRLGDGTGLGALCVIDYQPRTLSADEAVLLRALGKAAAAELSKTMRNPVEYRYLDELGSEEKRAEALDPLTRTWNAKSLEHLFATTQRSDFEPRPYGLLCLGIANYEQLQSSLSTDHLEEVIYEASGRIRQWLGELDFFGHVGSGEFAIILREPRVVTMEGLSGVIRDEVIGEAVELESGSVDLDVHVGYITMDDVPDADFAHIWHQAEVARKNARFLDGICKGPE